MNPFKKKTPISEIEAIANRASMTGLIQSASTRTHEESKAMLESSRLLKGRAKKAERPKKHNRLTCWVRQWLGVTELEKTQIEDLKFIASRFKFSGDVTAKYGGNWHGSLLLLQANQLDSAAKQLAGQDAMDLTNAAHSVRQLATKFIDKKENINNNENSEVTAS